MSGAGEGKTNLAAFDKALHEAGISNYNLITLSSVIPPSTDIVISSRRETKKDEYGHKLYVVLAESHASQFGEEAWSGLGWVKHNDHSGKGLFVEHSGQGEKEVVDLITNSLNSMADYRPEENGEIFYKTQGIKCKGRPVCSIVAAVYKSEGWS